MVLDILLGCLLMVFLYSQTTSRDAREASESNTWSVFEWIGYGIHLDMLK
jgi:hypothetical protein